MSKEIKTDWRAKVLAGNGVSAAIGTRLYAGMAPKRPTLPYGVFHQVAHTSTPTHDDSSSGLRVDVYQLDVYGATAEEAEETADTLRNAAEGNNFTSGSTDFAYCLTETEFDNYEEVPRSDGVEGVFRKILQFRIATQ